MSLEKWLSDNNDKKKRDNKFSIGSSKITLSELEQYLFEAANIIRGPIDKADYKSYIFPLLFFKRISDVYDEEFQQSLKESNGDMVYASFAENHRFQIPKEYHWRDIRGKVKDIGKDLTKSFREIEKANPNTLYGIFGDTQWTNKERLPDRLLKQLIEHFSKYNLSNSNVQPDIAGQAYEYLIKKFADLSKKKAGEFYTPRNVIKLMILILDPDKKDSIYDPACGTGGMLLEAVNHIRRKKEDSRLLKLFGQEKNLTTAAIARMNLILHGIEDFFIEREDTLRNPAFINESDDIMKFDCVIANPPFSLKNWGNDLWKNDKYGRNSTGLPPKSNGDFAWIQHMLSSIKTPNGKMAVVIPQGALFRGGSEKKIRMNILKIDCLDAVIGLGTNLFYGTPLAPSILVFRLKKEERRKKKVIFIDGSNLIKKGRGQNKLIDEHIIQIFDLYKSYKSIKGFVKIAHLNDIEEYDYNLNIPLYIEENVDETLIPLNTALQDSVKEFREVEKAEKKLIKILKEEGLIE